MFAASDSSKVTAACVVATMMMAMLMTEAAVVPKAGGQSKHTAKTHKKSSDDAALETVTLQLDPNTFVPIRNIRPLENASISPWAYNFTRDDSLFPPILSEARCLLRGCLDLEGQEDLNLESKPILHQVLQLRRVRSAAAAGSGAGHSYHYRLESRLMAVGCTCVRPTVQHQQ